MILNPVRDAIRRAFVCWPSRIGAASLLALALSWCSEAIATAPMFADAGFVVGLATR